MNMNTDEILEQRGNEYGEFSDVSATTDRIISEFDKTKLTSCQYTALFMIANKLSRIANGNANYIDSWQDIAGYAQLVVNELQKR